MNLSIKREITLNIYRTCFNKKAGVSEFKIIIIKDRSSAVSGLFVVKHRDIYLHV